MTDMLGLSLVFLILIGIVVIDRWQEKSGKRLVEQPWFPAARWAAIGFAVIGLFFILLRAIYQAKTGM